MNPTEMKYSSKRFRFFFRLTALLALLIACVHEGWSQDKQLIQVKTFDQQLLPMKNIEVSINGKDFFNVGNKGVGFVEVSSSDIPVKSVNIKNEEFEAASWNLSKGTLEIVVRKKSYQLARLAVLNGLGNPMPGIQLNFVGKKTLSVKTNGLGKAEFPIGLDETLTRSNLSIESYNILSVSKVHQEYQVSIEPLLTDDHSELASKPKDIKQEYLSDFNLSRLDSIKSLTVFYAMFKNYPIRNLDAQAKKRVDAKFNQLMT